MRKPRSSDFNYYEVQQFRQPWLWVLLLMATLPVAAIFAYGMIKQLALGEPWGNRPLPDAGLAVLGSIMILDCPLIIWFFHSLKLITEVKPDGVYIQFHPFRRKHIRFDEIKTCEARSYDPLSEYGGWGIRWWPRSGRAYNVRR